MADYIIGDIHGCIDELRLLLERVNFNPAQDKLWSVGDLVGRGPHPQQVLEFVDSLGDAFSCVLGNHDLHLLSVLLGIKPAHPKDRTEALLKGSQRDYWIEWLRAQPLMLQIPRFNLVMAHAGIYPSWSIPQAQQLADEVSAQLQQSNYHHYLTHMYHNQPSSWHEDLQGAERFRFIVNAFTRMRYCHQPDDDTLHLDLQCKLPPGQAPAHLQPWFNFSQHVPIRVVFGHWAALNGVAPQDRVLALDTGCVWGNSLTLYHCQSGILVQQKAG